MKAYKHLIKYAISKGHTISVYDGEEWQVKRSVAYKEIVEAIESVEEAEMIIRDKQGNKEAWASCGAFGLEDDETVMDYSDNQFMQNWSAVYDKYDTIETSTTEKYYLIYLQSGSVVDICSFDDQQTRDTIYYAWVYRDQNAYNCADFDQLQCFSQVV